MARTPMQTLEMLEEARSAVVKARLAWARDGRDRPPGTVTTLLTVGETELDWLASVVRKEIG